MSKSRKKKNPVDKTALYLDELYNAFTLMETKEEIKELFLDIATHTERVNIAKRLQIAKLLVEDAEYSLIKKEVGVSNETIAKVSIWLYSFGEGYKKAIQRLAGSKKQKKLPKLWRGNNEAKLAAGLAASGASYLYKKAKQARKRRSVNSSS